MGMDFSRDMRMGFVRAAVLGYSPMGRFLEALADPTVRRRLADLANETVPRDQQTPAALAAWQKAEIEKWWPIIKAAGIKAE